MALRVHDLAAVDVQGLAGDVSCVWRGEVCGHRSDFFGRLPLRNRCEFTKFFSSPSFEILLFRFREQGLSGFPDALIQGSLNHAWSDGVDAHAMGSEVFRSAFGEADECCFCCGVGRVGLRSDLSGHGHKKEKRARASLNQPRSECMRHVDGSDEVDVEHSLPVGGVKIPEWEAELS